MLRLFAVAVSLAFLSPQLSPTGTLRAVFLQTNPVQGRVDPQTGAVTGPVADLVRELARQKGVPFTIVPVPDAAAVIDHVNTHKADVGFLAYEAARAAQVDFSQPYLLMGSAYLVRADSPLKTSADVDRAGVKIASVKGQSQQIWVSANVKQAGVQILPAMPPDESVAKMIASGEIDAFAANRDRMEIIARKSPAVRVLSDNFMTVGQALVVEKGQASRLQELNRFVAEVRSSGLVRSAIERAGLSGVEVAQ